MSNPARSCLRFLPFRHTLDRNRRLIELIPLISFSFIANFLFNSRASRQDPSRCEDRRQPEPFGADRRHHPAAGLHRGSGRGCLDGADGLQRLAVLSAPQEEAAGTLHYILRIHAGR